MESRSPRLFDVRSAATYLSVSIWTVRSWVEKGELRPVPLPSLRRQGQSLRRVLFDRTDLDAFVERRRPRPHDMDSEAGVPPGTPR